MNKVSELMVSELMVNAALRSQPYTQPEMTRNNADLERQDDAPTIKKG